MILKLNFFFTETHISLFDRNSKLKHSYYSLSETVNESSLKESVQIFFVKKEYFKEKLRIK